MVESKSVSRFSGPTIEATVYTSDHISQQQNAAEKTAVNYMSNMFELADINYSIEWDFQIQDVPAANGVCDEPFVTWLDRVHAGNIPTVAKDINLLLADMTSGGCSNCPKPDSCPPGEVPDPGVCVAGFETIDSEVDYRLTGSNFETTVIFSMLHEVLHNLGMTHDDNGGFSINNDENATFHSSPMWPAGRNNKCGAPMESQNDNYTPVRHMYMHWCDAANLRVVGNDNSPGVPTEYPPTFNGQSPPASDKIPQPPNAEDIVSIENFNAEGRVNEIFTEFDIVSQIETPLEVEVEVIAGGKREFVSFNMSYQSRVSTSLTTDIDTDGDDLNTNSCALVSSARYLA